MNGFVLRILRLKKRLSQRTVASKAGISQPCVCRVETGDLPLSDDVRVRILEALDINEKDQRLIDVLLNERGEKEI